MLGVFATELAVEHKRLLRIVIAEVHENPVAFHMIEKESQLGIVLLVGALFLHREATLIVHGQARQRIPDDDGLAVDDLGAATRAQEKVVGAIRFIAGKANAHLGMLNVRVLGIV